MTSEIYKQFPLTTLAQIIREQLEKSVAFYSGKLAKEFTAYDEATKKGLPFAERQKLINPTRTAALERLLTAAQTDLKGFTVIPYEQWLEPGDYEMMKAIGFKRFIQLTMHHAYVRTGTR